MCTRFSLVTALKPSQSAYRSATLCVLGRERKKPEHTENNIPCHVFSTISSLLYVCMHACYVKRQVGLRGISLAVLALALKGWAAVVMLGVWGTRVAIARATEASDLKMTKVYRRLYLNDTAA